MSPPQTRRRVLRTLAAGGVIGVAGCATSPNGSADDPTAPSPTETTAPPTSTSNPTGGPDERVSETPPGSPALDPEGEWPTYRFDAGNTGYDPDGTGLHDARPYWRLNAGGRATVADGTLYNLYRQGRDYTSLTRRNPATAAVDDATRLVQYGTNAPPTVADGRVFVSTFVEVFCLAADHDEILWRGPTMDGIQGAPTVHDGTVFVNSGGYQGVSPHLRAFDADSGEEMWRYDTSSESKSTPAIGSDAVFVDSREGLHAVEATTGERRFVVEEAGGEWSTPVVSDGVVYAMAYRDGADELFAVDANDGTVRWTVTSEGISSEPPVVADDLVYVGTGDGLVELDASDGSQAAVLDEGQREVPVGRVGDVVYATGRGAIAAVDAGGEGRLWSHTTEQVQIEDTVGRGVYGVAPVDGAVYLSARDAFYGFGPSRS